jgi:outer membrane biosynthesis protein TonB
MTIYKKKSNKPLVWGISAAVAVMLISVAALAVKLLVSDDGQKRKRQIHMVTLLKPPPPPKIEEKPPEPEIKKKEEIIEPEPEEPEPEEMDDMSDDDIPPGDELGLDADGAAGADGFGLKAKKGGRALIGGSSGQGALLRKYAWYTRIIKDDIRKEVRNYLDKNGGIPEGVNCKVILRISLDSEGKIISYKIYDACGHQDVDDAIATVLDSHQLSEPPPEGMPKTIKLKISSKG